MTAQLDALKVSFRNLFDCSLVLKIAANTLFTFQALLHNMHHFRKEAIINFILTTPKPVFWKSVASGEIFVFMKQLHVLHRICAIALL